VGVLLWEEGLLLLYVEVVISGVEVFISE